ncbi:hypothetical protein AAHA92_02897 [Salvia divinorum]|uniref:Transposase MuDR plant domain-containing protein n=1 Tax=Salvia divinorum TaxID=28513 RepID=A0ABD1IFZ5_SALDI
MCRDEQLFASYFAEFNAQQEQTNARDQTTDATEEPSSNGGKGQKRHRYSPVVQNKDGLATTGSEHDLLYDSPTKGLRNLCDSKDEKRRRKPSITYTSFKLTAGCPVCNVGDVFGSKEFFMKVVCQYAIMSKRPLYAARNDKTKLRIKCHGVCCEWFIYVRKTKAYNGIDYVLLNMQRDHAHTCSEVVENKWITSKWLAERFTKKIKADLRISLQGIRQCVDE